MPAVTFNQVKVKPEAIRPKAPGNKEARKPKNKNKELDEDAVTCPVCFELFESPRQLPSCQHTFCLDCLEQFDREVLPEDPSRSRHPNVPAGHTSQASQKLAIRCPLCRVLNEIGEGGPNAFSVDAITETKVENFKKEHGTKARTPRPQRNRRAPRIINNNRPRRQNNFTVEMPDEVAQDLCHHCCELFMSGPTCCNGRCVCFSGLTALAFVLVAITGAVVIPLMIILDQSYTKQVERDEPSQRACLEFKRPIWSEVNRQWTLETVYNCKSFYVIRGEYSWLGAIDACKSKHTEPGEVRGLAAIQTPEDNTHAVNLLESVAGPTDLGFWIGLGPMKGENNRTVFEWEFDGFLKEYLVVNSSYYENWAPGEPLITDDSFYLASEHTERVAGDTAFERSCVYYKAGSFKWAAAPCSETRLGQRIRFHALCQIIYPLDE